MLNSDLILSLDPSSSVVGYCVATFSERLVDAGVIRPPSKLRSPTLRTDALVADVGDLVLEHRPAVVLVEIPGGKVHGRIAGKGHGLSTYGFAVGRIYEAVVRLSPDSHVVPVSEAEWTGSKPKAERAVAVMMKWRQINLEQDKGLDACDAAGLLLWWLQKQRAGLLAGAAG